jgi:hypothetical protein
MPAILRLAHLFSAGPSGGVPRMDGMQPNPTTALQLYEKASPRRHPFRSLPCPLLHDPLPPPTPPVPLTLQLLCFAFPPQPCSRSRPVGSDAVQFPLPAAALPPSDRSSSPRSLAAAAPHAGVTCGAAGRRRQPGTGGGRCGWAWPTGIRRAWAARCGHGGHGGHGGCSSDIVFVWACVWA